ncbi:MAG: serine/threonine protein kinase, partial [Deltaproteobacteria bacterium]|nr:serine/threonine protein kinase [Deltaproteobacteria bacterium]
PHCGFPHEADTARCPVTDRDMPSRHAAPDPEIIIVSEPPPRFGPSIAEGWRDSSDAMDPAATPRCSSSPPSSLGDSGELLRLTPRFLDGYVLDGKYRVEGLIGYGAMGLVYEGTHLALERRVVIKVIGRRHRPGSNAEKRFYREARLAGSIGHPNIVTVYDLGTLEDGCPYIVMERLVGETLADRIRRLGPMEPARVFEIAAHLLSALDATHARGIVHRDLKPENVFLARATGGGEQVKLLDFGVSQGTDSETVERPNVIVGTPHYLTPQQALGERVDHRADLFALGVTMYEMLTARLPFEAPTTTELLVKIVRDEPTPPGRWRTDLPAAVDSVIATAMAKDASDRYQTAAEMLDACVFAAAFLGPPVPVDDDITEVSGNYRMLRVTMDEPVDGPSDESDES